MDAFVFLPGPAESHGPFGGECDMENPLVGDPPLLRSLLRVSNPGKATESICGVPWNPNASTAPSSASTLRNLFSHAEVDQPFQAFCASFFCWPYTNDLVSTLRAQWLESAAKDERLSLAFKCASATKAL